MSELHEAVDSIQKERDNQSMIDSLGSEEEFNMMNHLDEKDVSLVADRDPMQNSIHNERLSQQEFLSLLSDKKASSEEPEIMNSNESIGKLIA